MKLSDFNPLNNMLQLTAGEAIARDDLIQLNALSSKALKVRNTDFAAVATITYGTAQTSAATGMIVAQTSISAGVLPAGKQRQNPLYIDGHVFIAGNGSADNNFTVYKYNSAGGLVGMLSITAPGIAVGRKIFQLSSGDIACVYDDNANNLYFQIISVDLSVIKSHTVIASGTVANSTANMWDAIPLSGGGFAVIFPATSGNLDKFATYDNAGNVVTALMTTNTRAGTSGAQAFMMKQLSDGNIVIAQASLNTGSSTGGYYSVITSAGVSVKAFTQVTGAYSVSQYLPCLEVLPGYFCIAVGVNAGAVYLAVCNNAGTLQGSVYAQNSTADFQSNYGQKIVTDGIAFYYIGKQPTGTKTNIVKITTTGATTVGDITPTTTNYGFDLDVFYDSLTGMIVGVSLPNGGNTAPTLWVVNPSTLSLINSANTSFGAAPGTGANGKIALTNLSDGAFVAYYSYTTTANNCFAIGKWANTAIIGVAAADTASGSLVPTYQEAGAYKINAIAGSPSKGFDMSAAPSCYGNKGTVFNNAVVLIGM